MSSDALVSDPAALAALFDSQQDPGWESTDLIFYDLQPGQTGSDIFAAGPVERFAASGQSTTVPEPGTLSILSPGLLLAAGLWARRQGERDPKS